ncbi:hypothetical protein COOONC_01076 [Cooperia oncophora]
MICDCDVEAYPARCRCPHDSIKNVRAHISNVFPISTPFIKLLKKGNSVAALSTREEVVVAIESTYMRDSAEYIIQQNCSVGLAPLTGCYDCQEGATAVAFCRTEVHTWVIVQCKHHVFSIECDPTNKTTHFALDFQQALIDQKCYVECNEHLIEIPLKGTLAFLPFISDDQIIDSHVNPWKSSSTWFHDWRTPDFMPLIETIRDHWKVSLAIFGTAALLVAGTYFLGPALLLTIIGSAPKILETLLGFAVAVVRMVCALLNFCVAFYSLDISLTPMVMDEVDIAIHIDPLVEAVKDLKDQLNMVIMSLNAKLDAVMEALNRQTETMSNKLDLLLERTKPKSSCVFCTFEDNKDNHPTGRCYRFADPVSRAVQASHLHLCNRCLQPRHCEDCGITCSFCSGNHNVLLCPAKASASSTPYKRRKV